MRTHLGGVVHAESDTAAFRIIEDIPRGGFAAVCRRVDQLEFARILDHEVHTLVLQTRTNADKQTIEVQHE